VKFWTCGFGTREQTDKHTDRQTDIQTRSSQYFQYFAPLYLGRSKNTAIGLDLLPSHSRDSFNLTMRWKIDRAITDWLTVWMTFAGEWAVPCWNCSDINTCDWQQATWQSRRCVYRSVETDTLRRCLAGKKVELYTHIVFSEMTTGLVDLRVGSGRVTSFRII